MKPAANISLQNVSRFTGMVEMRGVHFSAVIGGATTHRRCPRSTAAGVGAQSVGSQNYFVVCAGGLTRVACYSSRN
jgi:hypothetical protein